MGLFDWFKSKECTCGAEPVMKKPVMKKKPAKKKAVKKKKRR